MFESEVIKKFQTWTTCLGLFKKNDRGPYYKTLQISNYGRNPISWHLSIVPKPPSLPITAVIYGSVKFYGTDLYARVQNMSFNLAHVHIYSKPCPYVINLE